MDIVTESDLRILLRRRHLHGVLGVATRALIHHAVAQLRRLRAQDIAMRLM